MIAKIVSDVSAGTGIISSWAELNFWFDQEKENRLYWRMDGQAIACYMTYTITVSIRCQRWDITTEYTVSNDTMAYFVADFELYIPCASVCDSEKDFKNNLWYDLIFPRYQTVTNGEPYWDVNSISCSAVTYNNTF
jgi:hypothetical protein